jgi:hypothetical protein
MILSCPSCKQQVEIPHGNCPTTARSSGRHGTQRADHPDEAFATAFTRARSCIKKGLFPPAQFRKAYPPSPDCDTTR